MNVTLRQRLFLWYGGVLFGMAAVLVVAVYSIVAHKLKGEFDQFLLDEYREAVEITNGHLDDLSALERAIETEVRGARYFPFVYRLYDIDEGKLLLALATETDWLRSLPTVRTPHKDMESSAVLLGGEEEEREDRDEIHFLTGWPNKEDHSNLLLNVGLCYDRVWLRLCSLRYNLFMAFLVTTLVAALGGHLLASRGLRPIYEVAASLEQIGVKALSYRLPEPGVQDEIGRILQSVNSMLTRLEDAFAQLREFTADAAHELRTPLAAAKCRLDVALEQQRSTEEYQDAIRDALDRLASLGTLLDNLLLLAELEAKSDRHERQAVSLRELFTDISELFEVAAEQKGIRLTMSCAEDYTVTGNPTLLRRLFSNLTENAIRHTMPGREVRVEASCEDEQFTVTVTDTGVGMSTGDLAKVFRRFYTGDTARTPGKVGAGLGLSICHKIVEVHGGAIEVETQKGKGTTFIVHLPR
jgi:heavy metal sensor kinase